MLEIWQAGGLIASLQIKEEANPVAANAASL
jgi:hypothetical protein